MRKKILLSIIFIITCLLLHTSSFATTDYSGVKKIADLKAYLLDNDQIALTATNEKVIESTKTVNGATFSNVIYLEGKNTDKKKIVFGLDSTCIFGTYTANPTEQVIFRANTSSPVKKANEGSFTNSGVTVSTDKIKVNTGSGEYNGACGITVEFTNEATTAKYSAYTITLEDATGATRPITLVTKALALDKDDTSNSDVDTSVQDNTTIGPIFDPNDYKLFRNGEPLENGYSIEKNVFNEMVGKGKYKFVGANGISLLCSISQPTHSYIFSSLISINTDLDTIYNPNSIGKIMKLSTCFSEYDNRTIIIDFYNESVRNKIGAEYVDDIISGTYNFYVYAINKDLQISSTKINTVLIDGVMQFTLPKKVASVMISPIEINTTSATIVNDDGTINLVGPFLQGKKLETKEITDETVINTLNEKAKELGGKVVLLKDISVTDNEGNKINMETETGYQLVFNLSGINISDKAILKGLHCNFQTGLVETIDQAIKQAFSIKDQNHIVTLGIGFRFSPYALVLIENEEKTVIQEKDTTPKTGLDNFIISNNLDIIYFIITILITSFVVINIKTKVIKK